MTSTPADTVHAWLAAVNAGDVDAVLALSAPRIAMVGPRGTAHGHEVLRGWLGHAGATFETGATYARGDSVVVAQRGVWRGSQTGGKESTVGVATRFRVADDMVAELERYEELADALNAAGLSAADETALP